LLGTTSVDVRIAGNYRTHAQVLFLAEAGLEAGREALRAGALTPRLITAAGTDLVIATTRDLNALLATDDQPLLPSAIANRTAGQTLADATGTVVGTYHVWLRNDDGEGEATPADLDDVVKLVSIGRIGNATKTLEMTIRRDGFPGLPSALTLDGGIDTFNKASSNNFHVHGYDYGGSSDGHAIGVISAADQASAYSELSNSPDRTAKYLGTGGTGDVADVSGQLDPRLATVTGLEGFADMFQAVATQAYYPAYNATQSLGSIGGPGHYEITYVHGDASFSGNNTGYGTLVVRGNLTMSGNTSWNGLILIIGQGNLTFSGGGNGGIRGGILVAKTRDTATRSATEPLGDLLALRGNVSADLNGGGSNGIEYDTSAISASNLTLPYAPIAITEW
jgi:hypothetical protein